MQFGRLELRSGSSAPEAPPWRRDWADRGCSHSHFNSIFSQGHIFVLKLQPTLKMIVENVENMIRYEIPEQVTAELMPYNGPDWNNVDLFGVIWISLSCARVHICCAPLILKFVVCLRCGVGSFPLQFVLAFTVLLTTCMLFHFVHVAWSFAADSTNKFNKACIRSHQFNKLILVVMKRYWNHNV